MLHLPSFKKPERVPPSDKRRPPADIRCPLCGKRFSAAEAECGGCPLAARCGMVMCPNCSYEFPA